MRAICVCMEQFESRTLLSAGAVDPSYAPVYQNLRTAGQGEEVHAQLDGKMLHRGRIGPYTTSTQMWRTNANGSLDTTFGSNGVVDLGGAMFEKYEVGADGKIVALVQNFGSTLELRRYNANGSPDASFGGSGNVVLNVSPYSYYTSMAVQTDGKIVVIGSDTSNSYVRRFNVNGTVDSSFANG